MPAQQPDYYAVLGISRDAVLEEIKRAYHQAAQKLHPDKNQAPGDTEIFLEVQQAFEVLSNPTRRARYDATLPPVEIHIPPVLHEVYFSRPNLVDLNEPQLIYLLLEVRPREQSEQLRMPPLNIALVLDRSTSMQGEKMDMVKAAATQLVKGLRSGDVLSVVAFSDKAEMIVSAGTCSDQQQMEASIRRMQPSGATEIYKGLEAGVQEVESRMERGRVNHVILLTDGHTYGDEQACLKLAELAALQNIGISGMGIGSDWNDIFLDALTSRTGGSSAYISKPQDIGPFLMEKFKSLSSTFADEVVLEMKPQAGIELNYAFRIEPEAGPVENGKSMMLGPILHDMPLGILFEFVVQPSAIQGSSVTILDGSLKVSLTAHGPAQQFIPLRLAREVETHPTSDPPPVKILNALSRLTLYRLQERARQESAAGNFDEACLSLKSLASNLMDQGQHELARTALLEAENLEREHTWSSEGSKAIKYSTRSLLFSHDRGTKQ